MREEKRTTPQAAREECGWENGTSWTVGWRSGKVERDLRAHLVQTHHFTVGKTEVKPVAHDCKKHGDQGSYYFQEPKVGESWRSQQIDCKKNTKSVTLKPNVRGRYVSSMENSMTFILRNTINVVLLPFTISLSKVVCSFVKYNFYHHFLYRAVPSIVRDKTFRTSLTHSKESVSVGSAFNKFKLEVQKVK